ncbi:amidinotransferase [Paenibacillus sp. alder61]|uniref:dimethylarginine dimethylaminohydrolase family protein n=1 Tax=Paenibacillus sp. alder61 TaxID=2862948 RepID=UPI001CD4182B|nr:arginine deiminase family protein [Paenibacillus sp. alder61]MCA1292114.1 amidinotransferase [Paenibacillus sp. alder61]
MSSPFPVMSRKLVKEPFHDRKLLASIWGQPWGTDNPVGRIDRILMHRPGEEVLKLHGAAGRIESGPLLLNRIRGRGSQDGSGGPPNLDLLQRQHDGLTSALEKEGVRVVPLEGPADAWPEAMFTRDLGMVIPGGVVLSRFALYIRYGETRLAAQTLSRIGMPLLGSVQGHGFAEGGSFIMLDRRTAVIGRSERVNPEGIHQLRQILALQEIELLTVDLPASIIHLDEAFLMIDRNKALVNISLLPYWFLHELNRRHIELFHVDPRDPSLTINALALSPGKLLFSADGAYTMDLLSRHGIEVIPVEVSEITKMGGGIHCCTLPLIRAAVE